MKSTTIHTQLPSYRSLVLLACSALCTLSLTAQTYATGDPRHPGQPNPPAVCETLTADFSTSQRSNPPSSDDTSRIQSALNNCKNTGKSVVLAANGGKTAFYSDQLTLSGEGLVINSGITLFGGSGYANQNELVLIEGQNSFLGGPGTIDGRGDLVGGVARLVWANGASNLNILNLTLSQSIKENLYLQLGSAVTVWGVNIRTPATRTNADGIDIDSISDVTVSNSSVEAGDDGIAVKTNEAAASNITVQNSSFHGTHGLSIGSQTYRGVTNVLFQNNYVYGNDLNGTPSTFGNGISLKSDVACGGTVQQVTYRNTCMTNVTHLIVVNSNYGACKGTAGTPRFTDILVDGAKSVASTHSAYTSIVGLSSAPVQLYLADISFDVTTQNADANATVFLDNSNITPSGQNVTTQSFSTGGSVPNCSF